MELQNKKTQLLHFAYRYLSYRMRTKKEVETYLLQKAITKNIPGIHVQEVINLLIEDKYIDDISFVEEYVASRSKSKPKSEYALTMELVQKGIDKDIITSYFQTHTINEDQLAKRALTKKWRIFKTLPYEKRFKKSADFLQRRGFSFAIIKKTIEELDRAE